MLLVYIFSACLVLGMMISQFFDLENYRGILIYLTNVALAYIIIGVGLEFVLIKEKWRSYVKDYFVAAFAAALPWIFCFLYFIFLFKGNTVGEMLVIARFAAPTSSGILFAMLAAAGLGTTWLFRKVQILAIFDDLDTILLMIPLQFLLVGARFGLLVAIIVSVVILFLLAWRYLHQFKLPVGKGWLFIYGAVIAAMAGWVHGNFDIEIEVLLPAFVLGCLLYNPHDPKETKEYAHEHAFIEPNEKLPLYFDRGVKVAFMLLVGLILPKIAFQEIDVKLTIIHVLVITLLSNLGKCAPIFFYKKEASLKERIAVSIGMFPRGEVGAGILALSIEYGAGGYLTTVAGLSLALNLLLTGVFISIVIRLVPREHLFLNNGRK